MRWFVRNSIMGPYLGQGGEERRMQKNALMADPDRHNYPDTQAETLLIIIKFRLSAIERNYSNRVAESIHDDLRSGNLSGVMVSTFDAVIEKRDDLLAFKKTNQNTQEVNIPTLFTWTRQNSVRIFGIIVFKLDLHEGGSDALYIQNISHIFTVFLFTYYVL